MRSVPIFYSSELSSKLLWGFFCFVLACFFRTVKLLNFALEIEPREAEFVSFFLWGMLRKSCSTWKCNYCHRSRSPSGHRGRALHCALWESPPSHALFSVPPKTGVPVGLPVARVCSEKRTLQTWLNTLSWRGYPFRNIAFIMAPLFSLIPRPYESGRTGLFLRCTTSAESSLSNVASNTSKASSGRAKTRLAPTWCVCVLRLPLRHLSGTVSPLPVIRDEWWSRAGLQELRPKPVKAGVVTHLDGEREEAGFGRREWGWSNRRRVMLETSLTYPRGDIRWIAEYETLEFLGRSRLQTDVWQCLGGILGHETRFSDQRN